MKALQVRNTPGYQPQRVKSAPGRLIWIDFCKGIAIALIVSIHMLMGFRSAQMFPSLVDTIDFLEYFATCFSMQLFFLLSGYFYYHKRRVTCWADLWRLIKKKFIALMIPYFVFSWLQILTKLLFSDSVNHKMSVSALYMILIEPVEQFWFLYVLFFIFMMAGVLDLITKNPKAQCGVGAALFVVSIFVPNFGQLNSFLLYFFYFIAAQFFSPDKKDHNGFWLGVSLISFSAVFILNSYIPSGGVFYQFVHTILALFMGISGCTAVILFAKLVCGQRGVVVRLFSKLGQYSLPIFLLHTMFCSGVRIALLKLQIHSFGLHLFFGLIGGIVCPVLAYQIYRRIKNSLPFFQRKTSQG